MSDRARGICLRIGSIVVLIFIWWFAAIMMEDVEVLPGPGLITTSILTILSDLGPEGKTAYFHMGVTLARTFVAFGAAMLAGIGIGLTMGLRKTFEHSLMALIPLLLTMPTILMVFLAVLWFGFTEVGSIVAVVAVVTPFVSVNMFEGTKAMDKSLIDMAKTFRANQKMLVLKVYVPQLLPYIFSAFKISLSLSLIGAVVAEFYGADHGLGYLVIYSATQLETELLFLAILILAATGVSVFLIFSWIESRFASWKG